MKRLSLIVLYFILSSLYCFTQSDKELTLFRDNSLLKHAQIGVLIQKMDGATIGSLNKDMSLAPASVLKLVTTATTLDVLGADFRYSTLLKYKDGEIIVEGQGDPTLGSEHFSQNRNTFLAQWTEKIKQLNPIQPLSIYVKDDLFGYQGTSRKWIREDLGNYYAAGAYGISLFDNTYRLCFSTMDANKAPEIVSMNPRIDRLNFLNTLSVNYTGKDNGYIWGEPFSNDRMLVGDIPAQKTSFCIKGDIPDPGKYLAELLSKTLNQNGFKTSTIETARQSYYHDMYPKSKRMNRGDGKLFHTHQSPPLKDIIRVVNVKSNNHYTEHLIRTLGREQNKDVYTEPLAEGISFTQDYWVDKGLDASALFMYDGCGLSPSNAVSAQFMCDLLRYMYNDSKSAGAFIASLPKAGEEGTVRNFLKGTRLAGKVHVKSGSIASVQAFAGYYIDGDNKYVFAILVNKFQNEDRKNVVKAIETLLLDVLP